MGTSSRSDSRNQWSSGALLRISFLALLPGLLLACQSVPAETAVQVFCKGWPGSPDPEASETIKLRGQDIRCGIHDQGDFSFIPVQAANRVEFPDGATMDAEGVKLTLKRASENTSVGVGLYNLEINLVGTVTLYGPFANHIEAWLGDSPGQGEAIPLASGKLQGPIVIRCPVDLTAIMASGRAMIFGSVSSEEEAAEEPAEEPYEEPGEEPSEEPGEEPSEEPGEEPSESDEGYGSD